MPVLNLCRVIAHYFINRIEGYSYLDKWCITFRRRCVEARETPCLRPSLRVRRYLANVSLFLLVKQAQTRLIQYSLTMAQYSLESLAQKQASCHCLSIHSGSTRFQSTRSDSIFCRFCNISALPQGVRDKRAFLDACQEFNTSRLQCRLDFWILSCDTNGGPIFLARY
jgi:hypothetical protein